MSFSSKRKKLSSFNKKTKAFGDIIYLDFT